MVNPSERIANKMDQHNFTLHNIVGRVTHLPQNNTTLSMIDLSMSTGCITKCITTWTIDDISE
jgi:hypothetical protein